MRTTNGVLISKIYKETFKVYETFISVIKIDFMLSSLSVSIFIYFIVTSFNSFLVGGIVSVVFAYLFILGYSIIGVIAVNYIQASKESLKMFIIFIILTFVTQGFKIYFLILIAVNPSHKELDNFIVIAIVEIAAIDFLIAWIQIVLAIILITSFG